MNSSMTLDPQGANAMIKEAMNQQRYLNDDAIVNESTTDFETRKMMMSWQMRILLGCHIRI